MAQFSAASLSHCRVFLLTGRPGSGKTTIIRRLLARLPVAAGGFYTEEVQEQGRRSGFRIATLDGATALLADANGDGRHRVGRYRVHIDNLDRVAVPAVKRAVAEAALVVVDEIGKMELLSLAFQQALAEAVDSGKPVLGTIMLAAHPWADALKRRPDVCLIHVTEANRDAMVSRLAAALQPLVDDAKAALPGSSTAPLPDR